MKTILLLISALMINAFGLANAEREDIGVDTESQMVKKMIVIIGSYADFESVQKQALVISAASKKPFSMQGQIYDKKKGLRLPEDSPDEMYAGSYVHRRYNTASMKDNDEAVEYISIERSEAYPGFTPGFYIVVGGIYDTKEEAKTALAKFMPIVADAYTKQTEIFMGCMH
jgi:hypothetical protein